MRSSPAPEGVGSPLTPTAAPGRVGPRAEVDFPQGISGGLQAFPAVLGRTYLPR